MHTEHNMAIGEQTSRHNNNTFVVLFFKVVVLTVDASYHCHCAQCTGELATLDHISITTDKAIKGPDFLGFMLLKTQSNGSH